MGATVGLCIFTPLPTTFVVVNVVGATVGLSIIIPLPTTIRSVVLSSLGEEDGTSVRGG